MSWQPEIDALRRREALARRMVGEDKIKRQHDGGKLTIRERIDRLLDPGSFHEIGVLGGKAAYNAQGDLADFTASNFICGQPRRADATGRTAQLRVAAVASTCGKEHSARDHGTAGKPAGNVRHDHIA